MNTIRREDLVDGGIYVFNNANHGVSYLNKIRLPLTGSYITNYIIITGNTESLNHSVSRLNGSGSNNSATITEATPEQKHWLEECIRINRFIPSEEALQRFVKPFVLPEKWAIKNNDKLISDYFNQQTQSFNTYNHEGYHENKFLHSHNHRDEKLTEHSSCSFSQRLIRSGFTEITLEQFKEHVLKEKKNVQAPSYEILSRKTNGHTTSVANNEGNIFEIGDSVKTVKNHKFGKILSFKYSSKEKLKVLAVTERGTVGIDNIDHDLESLGKQSEPIDEGLDLISEVKRRFPEGSYIRSTIGSTGVIKDHSLINVNLSGDIATYNSGQFILRNEEGVWATIIEETLLEKARRLYPIGTIFNNSNIVTTGRNIEITGTHFYNNGEGGIMIHYTSTRDNNSNWTIYHHPTGRWAVIIE